MTDMITSQIESDVLGQLREVGVIAVIRAPSAAVAVAAVDALVVGGVTGIEVTFSTPDAADVIATVRGRYGPEVFLGAGTVLTGEQADAAVQAGATFLVSPGTTPPVARALTRTGAAVMLGVLTPSELMTAVDLGADVVKLFPASLGGTGLLRSLRGPFPTVPIMPTGGVNPDNLADWLAAGAIAVGAGSELCAPALLRRAAWAELTDRARAFTTAFQRVSRAA